MRKKAKNKPKKPSHLLLPGLRYEEEMRTSWRSDQLSKRPSFKEFSAYDYLEKYVTLDYKLLKSIGAPLASPFLAGTANVIVKKWLPIPIRLKINADEQWVEIYEPRMETRILIVMHQHYPHHPHTAIIRFICPICGYNATRIFRDINSQRWACARCLKIKTARLFIRDVFFHRTSKRMRTLLAIKHPSLADAYPVAFQELEKKMLLAKDDEARGRVAKRFKDLQGWMEREKQFMAKKLKLPKT